MHQEDKDVNINCKTKTKKTKRVGKLDFSHVLRARQPQLSKICAITLIKRTRDCLLHHFVDTAISKKVALVIRDKQCMVHVS